MCVCVDIICVYTQAKKGGLHRHLIYYPIKSRNVRQSDSTLSYSYASAAPHLVESVFLVWDQTGSPGQHSGTRASTGRNLIICVTSSSSPPVFTTSTACEPCTTSKPQRKGERFYVYTARVIAASADFTDLTDAVHEGKNYRHIKVNVSAPGNNWLKMCCCIRADIKFQARLFIWKWWPHCPFLNW